VPRLLALIARRRQRIVEDFYDIGEALARQRRPFRDPPRAAHVTH
jgi:hypothetical protein